MFPLSLALEITPEIFGPDVTGTTGDATSWSVLFLHIPTFASIDEGRER